MAAISTLVDRVKIVVISSGTGPFVLGPAVPAFRGVDALVDGATYNYATESGSNFEVGTGVFVQSLGQLVRSPLLSSSGGAAVAFPANIEVAFTVLAQDILPVGTLPIVQATGNGTEVAMSQKATTDALASKVDTAGARAAISAGDGLAYIESTGLMSLDPVQETGADPDVAMSQKATTDALALKVNAAELLAATGGEEVGTQRSSLGDAAAYRLVSSKEADRFDIRDVNGVDLTGDNDSTSEFVEAIAEAASSGDTLYIPAGAPPTGSIITLTAPVNIPRGVAIEGGGNRPYYQGQSGAWLQFAHAGKGLIFTDAAYPFIDGNAMRKMGTRRIQPIPTGEGWEPEDFDFDVVSMGADLLMEDFMFLNPTRAFNQPIGNAGRPTWNRVRGQPFLIGAQIDESYDGFIAFATRWWPFWSNDLYTRAFTLANRRGLVFGRCDNPNIVGWFDIFGQYAMYLAQNAAGSLNNGNFTAFEADNYGKSFLYSETGQTGGNATFMGGYSFGDAESEHAVELDGANTTVRLLGMRNHGCQRSVVKMDGAGNIAQINAAQIQWNLDNAGYVAYNPGAGTSRIHIDGDIVSEGGNGAAIVNDGVRVSSNYRLASTLTLAPSAGSITTYAALIAYRRQGNRVTYDLTVEITANGTGSGYIVMFGLPVAALTGSVFAAVGVDQGSSNKAVMATVSGTNIFLRSYDGTYPGYTGASFTISGSYEANPL